MIVRKCPCNIGNAHTLVSLFAGAGGLDIGLEQAGFATLLANELELHACESLKQNQLLPTLNDVEFEAWYSQQLSQRCYRTVDPLYAEQLRRRIESGRSDQPFLQHAQIVEGDVQRLDSKQILEQTGLKRGELTLVAGGPPCQPFSRSGKRETFAVSEGRLFREFVRIVNDLRPRWFLFENVKGLVQTKTDVLRAKCSNCGWTGVAPFDIRMNWPAAADNLECEKCGSGKVSGELRDERGGSEHIIVAEFERIGYRCYSKLLNVADFGAPQQRERLIIVGSRDGETFDWPVETHSRNPVEQATQLDLFDAPVTTSKWLNLDDVLWKQGHPEFGELDKTKAVLWLKNVVRPHDEPVTWPLNRPSPTIGAHQSAKLAIAPEGVPEEQLVRQQWHVLGKRQGDLPPVPVKHAYLSDQELLQLQTFPMHWYLYGTRMQRAFQIGNAVPPVLARAVGKAILSSCQSSVEVK